MRYNLYACLILLAFSTMYLWVPDNKARVIFNIGIGLSLSDITDRFLFDCTKWQNDDWIMICLTILITAYQYVRSTYKNV